MKSLHLGGKGDPQNILCLGAHADDIEIGAGGTLLAWIAQNRQLDVTWCVLSGIGPRQEEAQKSARDFLQGAARSRVEVMQFKDGFFPSHCDEIKSWFEGLKKEISPDLILTHRCDDAHQDHREVSRLTWNTFRDHLILEYEIPKWDGDFGQPNLFVPLSRQILARKTSLLMTHFATQRSKHWFDEETFRGLARLRGMECRAPERYAEGLYARKLILAQDAAGG
jgi:LmbE family N-acetylglucosaminyl deacetylase